MRTQTNQLTAFGKLVVKALIDQDMSKADLAAQIGATPAYLSKLLYGVRTGEKYIPAIIGTLSLDPREAQAALAA